VFKPANNYVVQHEVPNANGGEDGVSVSGRMCREVEWGGSGEVREEDGRWVREKLWLEGGQTDGGLRVKGGRCMFRRDNHLCL
jgi:hypothetical protein